MINLINNKLIKTIYLAVIFFILAVFLLHIPLNKISSQLPDHNDIKLVNYIWSWELYALNNDWLNVFNANFYAPYKYSLAFTENMFGSFLLALPVILSTHNITLAYNITVILSFIISGLGMYWLVRYLTKNNWVAIISALIYTFAPFKLIHSISHLNLTGMWLPYVFLYLHKFFFEKQSWKNIFLLTLFIILVFLTGLHYFIFLPIVIITFGLSAYLTKNFNFNKNNIKKIVLALIILLSIIIPISYPYFNLRQTNNFFRPLEVVEANSLDLIDYLIPPFYLKNYYPTRDRLENYAGLGLIVSIILLLAIIILIKNKKDNLKSNFYFISYSIIALVAWLFSFGIFIQFSPHDQNGLLNIYALFYYLIPGFDGIRAASRFNIFSLLSISMICGLGLNLWVQNKNQNPKFKKIFLIILAGLIVYEFSLVPTINYKNIFLSKENRELYQWIKQQPQDKIFFELPARYKDNIDYVYNSSLHFKKITNGYGGYEPFEYRELIDKTAEFGFKKTSFLLKKFKINYLIFHFDKYKQTTIKRQELFDNLQQNDKIKYIANFGENYVYEVLDE